MCNWAAIGDPGDLGGPGCPGENVRMNVRMYIFAKKVVKTNML